LTLTIFLLRTLNPSIKHSNPPPLPPPKQEDEDSLFTFLELLEEYRDQKPDEKALQEIKDKWLEAGNSVGNSFVSITVQLSDLKLEG